MPGESAEDSMPQERDTGRPSRAEQEQVSRAAFQARINELITPPTEGKRPVVSNESLRGIARRALRSHNIGNREQLIKLLDAGDAAVDENSSLERQWEALGAVIGERTEQLVSTASAPESSIVEEVVATQRQLAGEMRSYTREVGRSILEIPRQVSGMLESLRGSQRELIQRLASANANERRAIVSEIVRGYERQAGQYEQQTRRLVESLTGIAPEDEESRWVDVEYRNDFYARFQPGQEPKFYQRLRRAQARGEEWADYQRRIERADQLDARWQLARAAFIKKLQAGQADKMIENPELLSMTSEHLERLYRIPGVRMALEWYVAALVNRTPFEFQENRRVVQRNIFECGNGAQFEAIRAGMRRYLAGRFEVWDEQGRRGRVGEHDLEMRVADSVAWNLVWCSNLVESLDSRYGPHASGKRHGSIPGTLLASDDLRMAFHPQEKYEDKISGGQVDWGVFAGWGSAHLERIRREAGRIDRDRDELRFVGAASPREFWTWRVVGRSQQGGRIFEVSAPECHPTSTCRSFLEETQVETSSGDRRSLLDLLKAGEPIPWDRAPSDPWGIYLPTKLLLAVKLTDYFRGKDEKSRIPFSREGYEYQGVAPWAESILTLFQRLGISRKVREDERSTRGRRSEENLVHNLKVWAVFAGTTGVREPWGAKDRTPTLKPRGVKTDLEWILRSPPLRFLRGRFQALMGEELRLR